MEKKIKNGLIISGGILLAVLLIVAVAGIIKFNIIGNDVIIPNEDVVIDSLNRQETLQNLQLLESENNKVVVGDLTGTWLAPIPGFDPADTDVKSKQGFTLNSDGTAQSFNMSTLLYKDWKIDEYKLIMTAESIGNGTTTISEQSFIIEYVGRGILKLRNGENVEEYERQG
jgi:hypothetical protein